MTKKLQYSVFALIALALGLFLYNFEPSGPETQSKEVDINSLLNGDKSEPSNVVRSSLASRKNIDLTAQPSDFTKDDALAIAKIFKDVTSGTLAQKKPSLDKEKNTDLLALKAKFGSSTTSDIKYGPGGKVRSIYDSISIAALDHNNQAAISGEIQRLAEEHTALFGLGTEGSIRDTKVFCTDDVCATKLKKEFHGLPAWDHETTVSSKGDKIFAIMGEFYEPRLPKPQPYSITNSDAIAAVAKHFSTSVSGVSLKQQGELGIGKYGDMDYYAFRFQDVTVDNDPYDIYIDAETGNVTKASTLVHNAAVSASGTALDGSEVIFQAQQNGSTYQMIDSRFPAGTDNATKVFDHNNGSPKLVESSSATSGWPASALSALSYTKDTIDYFKNNHNTNAPYPNGSRLTIKIDLNEENAFFGLKTPDMVLGIGTGQLGKIGLSAAAMKDVVGHEITHGLISQTSVLQYEHQSGALNESFSDFFGAMIENEDWQIGEDWLSPSGKPVRNMANPGASLSQQPYHMDGYKRLPNTKAGDWGGVHTNSGIPNRALYMLTEGLQESIGRQKAANLAFKTMSNLTSHATFNDAAEYMINLAAQEYSDDSSIKEATVLAWKSVGLPKQNLTETNISSTSISSDDYTIVAWLDPHKSTSEVGPYDNTYNVYVTLFENDNPGFLDSATRLIDTAERSSFSRPILVNTPNNKVLIIYRRVDGSFYIRDTDGIELELDDGTSLADMAISLDSTMLALSEKNTNSIITTGLGAGSSETVEHKINIPSTAEGEVFPVTYIDKVRFDPTGRYVVFDFFLCQTGASDCTSLTEGYWSIGILDSQSGQVEFPFPSQPARFDVGFPTFSNLTDRYLAFDIVENIEGSDNNSVVAIFDRQEGSITGIANPDFTTEQLGAFGYPSFSSDDSSLVFSLSTDNEESTYSALLAGYKPKDIEQPFVNLIPYNSFAAYSAPLPKSTAKPSLGLSSSSLDFGQLAKGTRKSMELCLKNQGAFPIDVYDSTMPTGFSWNGDNRTILSGKSICSPVQFNSSSIVVGSFSTTFSISHNGVGTNTPVSLLGQVTLNPALDEDGDGYINATDIFPYDPYEWYDSDADGVGDNSDSSYDPAELKSGYLVNRMEACESENSTTTVALEVNGIMYPTLMPGDAINIELPLGRYVVRKFVNGTLVSQKINTVSGESWYTGWGCLWEEYNIDDYLIRSDSDNDKVLDYLDAFPQDAAESLDTDNDGIGNNSDTDDDNDGYSDSEEVSQGTDPLDANSTPMGGLSLTLIKAFLDKQKAEQ
ncbi:M4 family metallopeptidase [Porticoccaceae bacterium]|nr:M4 family metallopeptidase [Porticoccaceae bacterium]